MKSLKQDLVGFHWSAYFEPHLPFTRVPVKLPLPLILSLLPLTISLFDCLSLSPHASQLTHPPFSVQIVNLQ